MARHLTLWRKLVTVEWEQSSRIEQEDIDRLDDDDPLRPLLQAALDDDGAETEIELTPTIIGSLYQDWGWKGREVMEDRIEEADIELETNY